MRVSDQKGEAMIGSLELLVLPTIPGRGERGKGLQKELLMCHAYMIKPLYKSQ